MNREKILACVGVGEAELAHLRLLLRACANELTARWRIGDEASPDLLVADVRDFAGEMAYTRARGAGIRCAVFADVPLAGADLILRRPLQRANLVEILNGVGSSGGVPAVQAQDEDFYVRDLGIGMVEPRRNENDVAQGLDATLGAMPKELRKDAVAPPAAAPPRKYASREAMLEDTALRPLREYLDSDRLRGPSRVALDGMPPLVLDPKHRMAYVDGGLQAVEGYARARWRLCDWQPLTSADLAQVRATLAALPYAKLIWLDVLLHSGGHLARHLDPKATYRLTQWTEIDPGYGWVFRIASSMLQPMRLHEIAAASGGKMADVFDVVNAYDAIGLIECRTPAPSERERPARSLFGRFRGA